MPVSLNVGYDCVASESWIKVLATPPFEGDIVQDIMIKIAIDPNTGDEERNGYIVVKIPETLLMFRIPYLSHNVLVIR